jgi:hypothetical protein
VKQAALKLFRDGDGSAFEATVCNVLWRAASAPIQGSGEPEEGRTI